MRVLLIQPPYPFSEFPKPSSALMLLGAVLKEEGHEVRGLDLLSTRPTPAKIEDCLQRFQPQVVGTTSVTMNFPEAIRILRHCKRFSPEILTLLGGPHATFMDRPILQEGSAVDIVVRGEGEETLRALIRSLQRKNEWGSIRGISFRRNGTIVRTPSRPLIPDLNALPPPDRSLFPVSRYLALQVPVSILSSRGCPVGCAFCVGSRMMGQRGRFREPRRVVDEIEAALRLGFEEVCIDDDLFSRSRRHVRAICQEILGRRLRFKMHIFSRVDTVDRDLLEWLKEAGCAMICFGLESGSQKILDGVNKGITLGKVRRTIELCRTIGITPFGSFILGLPGETRVTMRETLAFARSLEIPFGFHLLAPFPGTPVRDRAAQYGLKILTNDWSLYDADHAVTENAHLPAHEVERFAQAFFQDLEEKIQAMREATLQGSYRGPFRKEMEKRIAVDFAWRMLSEDGLEKYGTFPLAEAQRNRGVFDPLEPLVDRIGKMVSDPKSLIRSQLERFFQKGWIQCRVEASRIRWQWREDSSGPGPPFPQSRGPQTRLTEMPGPARPMVAKPPLGAWVNFRREGLRPLR